MKRLAKWTLMSAVVVAGLSFASSNTARAGVGFYGPGYYPYPVAAPVVVPVYRPVIAPVYRVYPRPFVRPFVRPWRPVYRPGRVWAY